MNTIKFENKGNIKMIAHRGVSGLERENTCPAFVAAGVKSYFGIETDVFVTLDEKYIVQLVRRDSEGLIHYVEEIVVDRATGGFIVTSGK